MYYSIIYDTNTIPPAVIPAECCAEKDISFEILAQNGDFVHVGDKLIVFRFMKSERFLDGHGDEVVGEYSLISQYNGYVCGRWGNSGNSYRISYVFNGAYLLSISSEPQDDIQYNHPTYYRIETDPFTSEKYIHWVFVAGHRSFRYYLSAFSHFQIGLTIKDDAPAMLISFSKKDLHIRKNDSVSFKFEDGELIQFPITTAPTVDLMKLANSSVYIKSYHCVTIPLSRRSISSFAEKGWEMIRINHSNGQEGEVVPNKYRNEYDVPMSFLVFRRYAQEFLRALDELGIEDSAPLSAIKRSDAPLNAEEPCFVYLMLDTANGYHKIGISNHPEYREKTLQSEKPTIEKVCAKQFPSRLIAQSIESALHSAFASKRLRGEWFDLSDEEVAQILATLS